MQAIATKPKLNKKVFGTSEWAKQNANFINGCTHNCKYCYSKSMAIRFRRKTAGNWKHEEIREHSLNKKFGKVNGTIMFPSSHDIHPSHLKESIVFLNKILIAGNRILIVSKPHLQCIQAICDEFANYKSNILFRFTIGSTNSEVLKFWEPAAPDFCERLDSLKLAFSLGFQTSVSCEPMLDNNINDVISKTLPYITDAIWLGKANFLLQRLKVNGELVPKTIEKARQLIEWQSDENIHLLYNRFKDNSQIKWKESIKSIVGVDIATQKGLDI